ncbi:MAG: 2-amino-4-hydroxy-6-hydroxymethyldihydropteridine diphosphokinase [Deltaproteobacteria bacterium]|nr:2-amino-4-hydroxy-6-hydroxymethyldihydropteridine diphosphokinase [Deltaproteobacteria bacterium]
MNLVYIGLGSNIGDRAGNIRRALAGLNGTEAFSLLRVSSFYRTAPVGYKEQAWFANAVAEGETSLPPSSLLKRLQLIEREMGRDTPFKWGPRNIDLDLLFYGDRILEEKGLTVPHPFADQRRFVMEPLAELVPEGVHPVTKRNFQEILKQLGTDQFVEKMETPS